MLDRQLVLLYYQIALNSLRINKLQNITPPVLLLTSVYSTELAKSERFILRERWQISFKTSVSFLMPD